MSTKGAKPVPRIIDGDGHLMEDAPAIASFLPSPYKEIGPFTRPSFPYKNLFPPIDHLHPAFRESPATLSNRPRVGPEEWLSFLDDVGIETTVLYPSAGLAYGRSPFADEAIAMTRAYNDWLASSYLAASPRFKGMGLLPMQDPETAVRELRHAFLDLRLTGVMLPSTGLEALLALRSTGPSTRRPTCSAAPSPFTAAPTAGWGSTTSTSSPLSMPWATPSAS